MIEQYYVIGTTQFGPVQYYDGEYLLVKNLHEAKRYDTLEELPAGASTAPEMVLKVSVEMVQIP